MRFHRKLSYLLATLAAAVTPAVAAPTCNLDNEVAQKLNLPIYEWSDPSAPSKGTVVAIHGLTFYAAAYDDFAKHLAEKGYKVYAADMRGFGRWKDEHEKFKGDDKIHFTQSTDDVVAILKYLKGQNSSDKIICMGESLGANIALLVAAEHPELVDGAIVSAPCVKTCVHPSPRWAVDFWKGLIHPNKPFNLEPYIEPYLSSNKDLTKACMADQKIMRSMSVVELIKAMKTNKLAIDKIDSIPNSMPLLVMAGKKDQVVKASALPPLVSRLKIKDKTLNIVPNHGHLMIEHQSLDKDVAKVVDTWLDKHQPPSQTVASSVTSATTP
ncbi:MAG TPA: alpha/beta fold hydrolase [Drouetiella sp.]